MFGGLTSVCRRGLVRQRSGTGATLPTVESPAIVVVARFASDQPAASEGPVAKRRSPRRSFTPVAPASRRASSGSRQDAWHSTDARLAPLIDAKDVEAVEAALKTVAGPERLTVMTNNRVLSLFAVHDKLAAMEAHYAAMRERNAGTYACVVKSHLRHGRLQRAADCLEEQQADRREPGVDVVAEALAAVAAEPALRLLAVIRRSGFRPDEGHVKRLNDQIWYITSMAAKEVYIELLQSIGAPRSVVPLSMLIELAAKEGDVERGEYYFNQIAHLGLQPTTITYTSLIDCHRRAGRLERCFELETEMRAKGLALHSRTYVLLISAAGEIGQPDRIGPLLDECLRLPDVRASAICNAVLLAAANCADYDRLPRYLASMRQRGLVPTVRGVLMFGAALGRSSWHRQSCRRLLGAVYGGRSSEGESIDKEQALTPEQMETLTDVVERLSTKRNVAERTADAPRRRDATAAERTDVRGRKPRRDKSRLPRAVRPFRTPAPDSAR